MRQMLDFSFDLAARAPDTPIARPDTLIDIAIAELREQGRL
jgi:hypothetical protein